MRKWSGPFGAASAKYPLIFQRPLAFSTLQGSGSAPDSFIGTAGVDSITFNTTVTEQSPFTAAEPFFLSAEGADDSVLFSPNDDQNINVAASTLRGGAGNDSFVITSNRGFKSTFTGTLLNGNGDNDFIAFDGILANSTIQGGQGSDIINVEDTLTSSIVNGNKEADLVAVEGISFNSSIFGGQGDDTVLFDGELGSSLVAGNDGDDLVEVEGDISINSTIQGNDGNDVIAVDFEDESFGILIQGNNGNDDIFVESVSVNAAIEGNDGNDLIDVNIIVNSAVLGGLGVDEILVSSADGSLIDGNEGEDIIEVDFIGDSTVLGGLGADIIEVVTARDSLIEGNDGDDIIEALGVVASSTFLGGQGNDTITSNNRFSADGGADNDTLNGSAQADTLSGSAGNDVIVGGVGADSLTGGEGDDRFIYNSTADIGEGETIDGGAGVNTIVVRGDTDFTDLFPTTLTAANIQAVQLGNEFATTTATFTGSQLTGQAINFNATTQTAPTVTVEILDATVVDFTSFTFEARDGVALGAPDQFTIEGTVDNNAISGPNFASAISGFDGNDSLNGGTGNDTIDGGDGVDTINGGGGNDTLTGGTDADIFNGGAGVNTITDAGIGLNDVILQSVAGSTTTASVEGGEEVIVIATTGGLTTNSLDLSTTFVNAESSLAGVTLNGGANQDSLLGGIGNDSISGGGSVDTIFGDNGNDIITGGAGADQLTGGDGEDQYNYLVAANALVAGGDTITGFNLDEDLLTFAALNGITGFVEATAGALKTIITSATVGSDVAFVSNATGTVGAFAEAQFIYNTATGALAFDADGNGVAAASSPVATLTGLPVLTADQFTIA